MSDNPEPWSGPLKEKMSQRFRDDIIRLRIEPDADEQKLYVANVFNVLERVARIHRLRYSVKSVVWSVSLLLGAAIPFGQSLNAPDWVAASLGFAIVGVQAVDRLLQRLITSSSAEELVRSFSREIRTFAAGVGAYEDDASFERFASRIESVRAEFDSVAVESNKRMFADG